MKTFYGRSSFHFNCRKCYLKSKILYASENVFLKVEVTLRKGYSHSRFCSCKTI